MVSKRLIYQFFRVIFVLLVVLFLVKNSGFAQKKSIRFQHFTTENGLPQNMVDCIWEDSKGFMWFGTWNGICRFDGYNFREFYDEKGESRTNRFNNFIYSISEDAFNNIWVGTDEGLSIFIYHQESFKRFKNLQGNWPVINSHINVIYAADSNSIWLGGKEGLACYASLDKLANLKLLKYYTFGKNEKSISGDEITSILTDKDNDLWIGTNEGISILKKNQNKFIKFVNQAGNPNSIPNNAIHAIYEDTDGLIWIGTENGLSIFNKKTNQFTNYYYSPFVKNSIVHNSLTSIAQDHKGNVIIGTLGGLSIFSRNTPGLITNYISKFNSEYELNNDFINCLLVDTKGNIWIGTDRGGINKYNSNQNEFEYFEKEVNNQNSLNNNTINSVLEDHDYIWIGTAGGGLNRYTKSSGTFMHLENSPSDPGAISSNFVTAICNDNNDNLWVATWGGGLNKLISGKTANPAFKSFKAQDIEEASLINDFVSSLVFDKDGNLWVGTFGGLDKYNMQTQKFEHFNMELGGTKITRVGCLAFDSQNNLWVGTKTGLYEIKSDKQGQISLQTAKVIYYKHREENKESLSGNYVISILKDSKGQIWIGTYGNGLNLLVSEQEGGVFKHFTKENGLSNNVIYTILEDNQGYLWMSTDYGLSRLSPNQQQFRNFYIADGLQNNQYYWSASYKNSSGKLYFGGMNGLNAFYPEKISESSYHPKVVFTDFRIFNESVKVGEKYFGRIVLTRTISETKEITISYKANEFLLEFSALDFEQSELNEYAYKLEGFDKDWNYIGAKRRFASYTNLEPDDYILKVRTTNNKGEWTEIPTMIKISIIPPFWRTWWFRILLVLVMVALVIAYNRYRIISLQQQKKKLEIQVKERTIEIKNQNEKLEEQNKQLADRKELIEGQKSKLEKQNEEILNQRDKLIELNKKVTLANQYKLRFFTNVSHEFRTPLTLILGPLEKLLQDSHFDSLTKNTLLLINRNAQRLLHLINQLMEFRKIEKGRMELKISKANIVDFTNDVVNAFNDLAKQKNIILETQIESVHDETWFDHEKIENILFNLLSNAFKYTFNNGKISVKVYMQNTASCPDLINKLQIGLQGKNIVFEVADTGKGIDQEVLPYIFNRFYRGKEESNNTMGTGIGLSLAKELIKVHGGKIRITSELGKGTNIYFVFPVAKEYYKEEYLVESTFNTAYIQKQVDNLYNEFLQQKKLEENRHHKELKYIKKRPTILIAEDNADLREFLAVKLNENYNILEAENGKVAHDLAIVQNPSIIISDIMMPEMDGIELCKVIKENITTSHIPVILLTSKSNVESRIEGLESGADDYLAKPFNFNLLEARIQNLIESRKKLLSIFVSKTELEPSELTTTSVDERFLKNAIKIIENNLNNPDFGVSDLISEMNMSRSTLHKKFTALTNQSTVDFINNIKLKKSIALLKNVDLNISEVAYSVGYNDPKYYSRIFKKVFGKTPTEFQRDYNET